MESFRWGVANKTISFPLLSYKKPGSVCVPRNHLKASSMYTLHLWKMNNMDLVEVTTYTPDINMITTFHIHSNFTLDWIIIFTICNKNFKHTTYRHTNNYYTHV